jgi:hypothetical protein
VGSQCPVSKYDDEFPKRECERKSFEGFLELSPEFADGRVAKWWQPEDEKGSPDIKGQTDGHSFGVELGQWLNEDEILRKPRRRARNRFWLRSATRDATTPAISIMCGCIPRVVRLKPADQEAFRDQLFALIWDCDARWTEKPYWQGRQGARLTNAAFTSFPLLAKYL